MLHGLRVRPNGLDLTFTDPIDPDSGANPENYSVQVWNYAWTRNYGSPEFSVADPGRKGHDELSVQSVRLSADGRTVSLDMAGIRPVMQMMIRVKVKAADGAAVKFDVYNTINEVP
jgi:hypothetical protein